MKRATLTVAALCCLSGTARADDDDKGFYFGLGGGRSTYKIGAIDVDENATAWKGFAGYLLNKYVALELAYIDAGSAEHDFGGGVKGRIDASLWQASALGTYWFSDTWGLYGRLGANKYDAAGKLSNSNNSVAADDSGTEFGWGAGIQAYGAGASWRLEYESAKFQDVDGSLITLSVVWRL